MTPISRTDTGPRPRTPLAALVALAMVGALLAGALSGCASGKQSLVGTWVASAATGKAANLSDLTLAADGTFKFVGKNALGGKVTFAGTYAMAKSSQGPTVTLTYHDFPSSPVVWFYAVDGKTLKVSNLPGNLKNGTALEFTRQ